MTKVLKTAQTCLLLYDIRTSKRCYHLGSLEATANLTPYPRVIMCSNILLKGPNASRWRIVNRYTSTYDPQSTITFYANYTKMIFVVQFYNEISLHHHLTAIILFVNGGRFFNIHFTSIFICEKARKLQFVKLKVW